MLKFPNRRAKRKACLGQTVVTLRLLSGLVIELKLDGVNREGRVVASGSDDVDSPLTSALAPLRYSNPLDQIGEI